MKAVFIENPGEAMIRDIPRPARKPGEALLKLLYGGICGSDLGSYRGTLHIFPIPERRDMNFPRRLWRSTRTTGG